MKKLLLLIAVIFFSILRTSAQCTPDPTFTEPGIYPDSATGFGNACVGDLYEQVVTNIVPIDTTVQIVPGFPAATLDFDSIVIISFTGLPASMTYDCSTTWGGCAFAGGESGCVLISGTPTAGEEGTYNPVITVDVYLGGTGIPSSTQDIDWYVIDVMPSGNCNTGILENTNSSIRLFPNPTENKVIIDGLKGNSKRISVLNINGQLMTSELKVTTDSLELNVSSLDHGLYFVKIDSDNSSETIRFIKR